MVTVSAGKIVVPNPEVTVCVSDPLEELDLQEIFKEYSPIRLSGFFTLVFITLPKSQVLDLVELVPYRQGLLKHVGAEETFFCNFQYRLILSPLPHWYPIHNVKN